MSYEITDQRDSRAAKTAREFFTYAKSSGLPRFDLDGVMEWIKAHNHTVSRSGITRRIDYYAGANGYTRAKSIHPTWVLGQPVANAAITDPALELRVVQIQSTGAETIIAKLIINKGGLQKALDSVLIPVHSQNLNPEGPHA